MWAISQYYQTSSTASGGVSAAIILIYAVIIVLAVAALWKIFTKAGQAGWKALIPIYNAVIELRIVGMSGWYVLLLMVPFVGQIFAIYVAYKLSKAFGYGIGMTILQMLFIGVLILGFGKAKYLGPDGAGTPGSSPAPAGPAPTSPTPPVNPMPPVNPAPPAPPAQPSV